MPSSALTEKEGRFSVWKGHNPTWRVPTLRSARCSPTMATKSVAARTLAMSSSTMPIPVGAYDGNATSGVADHRLRRGQPGDGHAEGGARHVVEPDAVEEVDRLRVPAVLAAHAQLEIGPGGPAPRHGVVDQLTDAGLVDGLERVALEQAFLEVGGHHAALHVVAGEAEGHLGQIVGAEA